MKQHSSTSKRLKSFILFGFWVMLATPILVSAQDSLRTMKYTSRPAAAASAWQDKVRSDLFKSLKMQDLLKDRKQIAFDAKIILSEQHDGYRLEEVEFNSTPTRRIKVVLTVPSDGSGPFPAVVCIHGHDGEARSVYDRASIYKGFASELAARHFVTIAPFVSQHVVYEKDRTLMGERLFDCMRCVDYLQTLPTVDASRIGCAGLSLGGEMSMWLGAMDTRIQATVSCGFLTKMDHMEHNHCLCWKFPGLRELVDDADIYSLTAPRPLMCQNGIQETRTQFYVPLAREAFGEIQVIYADFKRPENVSLDIHGGAHEVDVPSLVYFLEKNLSSPKIGG